MAPPWHFMAPSWPSSFLALLPGPSWLLPGPLPSWSFLVLPGPPWSFMAPPWPPPPWFSSLALHGSSFTLPGPSLTLPGPSWFLPGPPPPWPSLVLLPGPPWPFLEVLLSLLRQMELYNAMLYSGQFPDGDVVVHLVVKNLGRFARQGSRIWWCPTSVFNFLPLQAAGQYWKDGQFLSQFYISSYTPSLTALIKARRHDRSLSVSFAAIGQNLPAGHSFTLDFVEPELELVQSLLPPPPTVSFTKITSVDATKSRALCALRDNTWLHFTCHGTQNFDEPFNSAFLMCDQPLSLLDITQMDLSRHQFVFLSACETAVGDLQTPDKVIHLVAGLQFAGVKSVIGTLWTVNDSTVQRLVEAFYKNLCGDGKMNSKQAARALHKAAQSLACDKDMPLEQHIVFVHIGI
ncbi:CHAT domain-containing protein [Suillus subluteus]|nr:CHAT domain-containing protein [Suillus subluteus]